MLGQRTIEWQFPFPITGGLPRQEHTVEITVLRGRVWIDGYQCD